MSSHLGASLCTLRPWNRETYPNTVSCCVLALVRVQSRFGDKLLGIWLVCPQNGTAVLKGLTTLGLEPLGSSKRENMTTKTDDSSNHCRRSVFGG